MGVLRAPAAPPKNTLGVLEVARFIAASDVVLTHLKALIAAHTLPHDATVFGAADFPGPLAVQFFFVLSGFVMITAHHRDFGRPWAPLKFWWRRACRIYPMYWIALIIPIFYLHNWPSPASLTQLITLQPVNVPELVGPAWSLRYEIDFYIIFGLCLLPYIGRFLLFFWVVTVCYAWCPVDFLKLLHLPIPFPLLVFYVDHNHGFFRSVNYLSPNCFYFFAGLLGGSVFARLQTNVAAGAVFLGAGIAGLVASLRLTADGYTFGGPSAHAYVGLAFAGIITGAAMLERQGLLRFGVTARRLGAISYPLYIIHLPLLVFLYQVQNYVVSGLAASAAMTAAILVFIYAVSALLCFGVDQPLQKFLRRRNLPGIHPAGSAGSAVRRQA